MQRRILFVKLKYLLAVSLDQLVIEDGQLVTLMWQLETFNQPNLQPVVDLITM